MAQGRLTPVAFNGSHGVAIISDDGKTFFFFETGIARYDRTDGSKKGAEVLRLGILDPMRPNAVSRTTSQNINGARRNGTIYENLEPSRYGAAADHDHLLVAAERADGLRRYFAVAEIAFRERGPNPNRNWVLVTANDERLSRLVYGRAKTVEAWTTTVLGREILFRRYEARLAEPGKAMRQTTEVRAKSLGFPNGGQAIVNIGDVEAKSYTFWQRMGEHPLVHLVDRSGRILRTFAPKSDTMPTFQQLVEWNLNVDPRRVPGGKAPWRPLAFSGNRKYWLLERIRDGRRFLLRL